MKRTEKYQDTDVFHYWNANPKNRITGDCTFRAISSALGKTWEPTVMEMAELSCRTGYAINDNKGIERYLKEQGWEKHPQPRKPNGRKYTGREFCEDIQDIRSQNHKYCHQRLIAKIGGHHIVAIGYGRIYDIWDCSEKCIGNYWTRKEDL